MMHPEAIKEIIAAGIACERLEVKGDGEHFEALIVSAEFVGKSRVARQQLVNALLRADFDSGRLHALSMKAMTPQEWSVQNG
jgi:acid stress-induced BolA-like protein IbaG/YrbA